MEDPRKRKRHFLEDIDGLWDEDFMFGDEFHRRIHEHIDRIMRDAFRGFENVEVEPGKSYVYGFRMQTGPDGKPEVEEFGNVPKPGLEQIPGEREPLVDVIDGRDEVTVIAELPGVEKGDIEMNADERNLSITVETKERRYHKELGMPADVDPDSIKAAYKNGILEVKLKRRERKAESRKRIRIE